MRGGLPDEANPPPQKSAVGVLAIADIDMDRDPEKFLRFLLQKKLLRLQ